MAKLVVNGAKLSCNQGTSPGSLTVLPTNKTDGDDVAAATVDDYQAMVNLAPFGMCQSMSNPQVSAATSAAQGVLTPQPCVPMVSSAWSPGASVVTINDTAALTDSSTCNCQWGGTIQITKAGSDIEVD